MDVCRRGEDPSAVFTGDRDRGGGRCVRLLRRIAAEVVMAGMEPSIKVLAQPSRVYQRVRASLLPCSHLLSCMSIDSDAVTVLPRLGGDFSGEEKMPEIGSRPLSSRTPLSSSVIPVFL